MKKVCIFAILAACMMGCGEDSKDKDPSGELNCAATNQVECNGACYDACEGGAALDAECKCPTAPVDKTCEEQGKVTCNGTCYDPCPDGKSRDSQCNCPEPPADKTCEEQDKIECNGACYAPCEDGANLDENCQCPSVPAGKTCEDEGKITCNEACYDPCEDGADLDENCQCPGAPVDKTCEDEGKITCNGACYDPCEDGADLDENCQCPGAPADKTCEEQGKVTCKGACYDACEGGAALDENCKCPAAPEKPKNCEKTADCGDSALYCVKGVCKADNSECDCEAGAGKEYTCKDYDDSINWNEGGHAICSDMCELQQGTCKAIAVCGNGVVEDGEKCDFGKNDSGKPKEQTTCSKYSPQYSSGNVTCKNDCKDLDESSCASGEHNGLYYCQLMAPDKIVFGPDLAEATLNSRVAVAGVTDKTTGNDGGVEAELVYGTNIEDFSGWKSIAATADSSFSDKAIDAYTANLTKAKFAALESEKVYYTFRFREKSTDEWKYCKSNSEDPNLVKGGIKFINVTDTGTDANVHEIGVATAANVSESNILAQFTFDSHKASEKDANAVHSAEVGTGSIQGKGIQCQNGCFANDDKDGIAWNIRNWMKEKDKAVKEGAHILITGLDATEAKDIGLDMRISRKNITDSPTHVVVLYSFDEKDYTEVRDIELNLEKAEVFFDYSTVLPSTVNGQSKLSLKLVPYGGVAQIRLDDITISKNHPE